MISGLRFVDSNVLGSIFKRGWSDVSRLYVDVDVDVDVDVEVPLFSLLGDPWLGYHGKRMSIKVVITNHLYH